MWEKQLAKDVDEKDFLREKLKMQVWQLKDVGVYIKEELIKLIEFGSMRKDIFVELAKMKTQIETEWPVELREFLRGKEKDA